MRINMKSKAKRHRQREREREQTHRALSILIARSTAREFDPNFSQLWGRPGSLFQKNKIKCKMEIPQKEICKNLLQLFVEALLRPARGIDNA